MAGKPLLARDLLFDTRSGPRFPVGRRKDCFVHIPAFRFLPLAFALVLVHPDAPRAEPITIEFIAQIGTSNAIDTADVFGEGYGANLAGQVIAGSVTVDPSPLTELCATGGACYGDFGAGAISVSFTLNGITSTTISTGTTGYFGGRSGGSVVICDPSDGGNNYVAVGASSPDGMVQQSIGALFTVATQFDAYGNGDPGTAIDSLDAIGNGSGLVKGGITYMNPVEHLDATILSIHIPEPAGLAVFGVGLLALAAARRAVSA
jgi:hypothetical protein